ncbi:glucose-6-phosphate isomerase [Pseudomonas sp. S 311-6]|nr:glucose-6-phosphate isomerase [Pseudomonas sp. S 311-6]
MSWNALLQHALDMKGRHIASLFAGDPARFDALHCRFGPLLFDYSKQRLLPQTLDLLCEVARESGLEHWMGQLFGGAPVNATEQRAALHWALRVPEDVPCVLDGEDIGAQVHEQLRHMERIVRKVHAGQWRGVTGEAITNVVNIGVGGSDLGPQMVSRALAADFGDTPVRLHFASTMDGSQLAYLLRTLNPHTTLFIISSKSFTTVDTLANADTALHWLRRSLGNMEGLLRCHFIGVSAVPEKMTQWGIPRENQLRIWDWVGGRFSLWSAIGLPIALALGMDGFRSLLRGARDMDEHFRHAPWRENLPVLMALVGVWNINALGVHALAVLPYDGRLHHLPAYLEQLEMESNGKSIGRDGKPVSRATCPIIWGGVGPNAQHAFYQLLHQGTEAVSCDFIVPVKRYREQAYTEAMRELVAQHELALANCLAQSRLLALGDAALPGAVTDLPVHMRYRGNQACSTLLLDELSPYSLGALVAMYEHKVFVQSVIWGINPFDQWGVEMGKRIATETLARIRATQEDSSGTDVSTAGLLRQIRQA